MDTLLPELLSVILAHAARLELDVGINIKIPEYRRRKQCCRWLMNYMRVSARFHKAGQAIAKQLVVYENRTSILVLFSDFEFVETFDLANPMCAIVRKIATAMRFRAAKKCGKFIIAEGERVAYINTAEQKYIAITHSGNGSSKTYHEDKITGVTEYTQIYASGEKITWRTSKKSSVITRSHCSFITKYVRGDGYWDVVTTMDGQVTHQRRIKVQK